MKNTLLSKLLIFVLFFLFGVLDNTIPTLGVFTGISFYIATYFVILNAKHTPSTRYVFFLGLLADVLFENVLFGYFTVSFLIIYGLYRIFYKNFPGFLLVILLNILFIIITSLFFSNISFIIVLKSVIFLLIVKGAKVLLFKQKNAY